MRISLSSLLLAVVVQLCAGVTTLPAQSVSPEQIFKYRPVQAGAEVETPPAAEIPKCKVEVERSGKSSGWVVYGPEGQTLRRFIDTDGDNVVDQWRYYQHGLEVYRDIDSNADNDVDQSRWLNMAGTRWGIDADQNGTIERWKRISAEEASREAITAMVTGNAQALAAVLITAEDIEQLGITGQAAQKLRASVADPQTKMRQAVNGSKVLRSGSKWVRFDSSMLMPNLVPAESGLAEGDVMVYENVMAIVENNGETGFVQIGEMILVADAWKLTKIPQPLEGDVLQVTDGGILMQPALAGGGLNVGSVELSPEVRKLVDQLQALDEQAPPSDAPKTQLVAFNQQRADLLGKLSEVSTSAEERETWLRQQVDGIAAAVQMDAYPDGVATLSAMETDIKAKYRGSQLVPYVTYRRMLAEYNVRLQQSEAAERAEVQSGWLKQLEDFIDAYPEAEDAADAMLQLGMANEFAGQLTAAKTWYTRLASEKADAPAGAIAAGAVRRFNLKGSPIQLAGPTLSGGRIDIAQFRGKVVAVLFWATWCRPCTEDLPQIQELYAQHRAAGFEIIGVNVDLPGAPIQDYIRQYKVTWPHIHEDGGLQGGVAQQFGVITLPTMFLVDKTGKVVSAAATVDELKTAVPELVKQ